MKTLTWSDLKKANLLEAAIPDGLQLPSGPSICTDTRQIMPNRWYLPLQGQTFDGHQFIGDALNKGARGFFFQKDRMIDPVYLDRGVAVADTLTFLKNYATLWRNQFDFPLVGITGSNGKTTVKDMLTLALRPLGRIHATEKNYNNNIGLPLSLLQLEDRHKGAVMEMGARHPGDIKELVEIASPTISCLLGAQSAHLGEFGSIENLRTTKCEILRFAPASSTWVVNRDDEGIWQMMATFHVHNPILSFGYHPEAMFQISSSTMSPSGMDIHLKTPEGPLAIELTCSHDSHPLNVAAAIACCWAAQVPLKQAARELRFFQPPEGRFSILRSDSKTIINDAYNANPDSMIAGLETVAKRYHSNKKCFVIGDMLELGPSSEQEHLRVADKINFMLPDRLVTVGSYTKLISSRVRQFTLDLADGSRPQIFHFDRVEDLIKDQIAIFGDCDLIYIKGSNGLGLQRLAAIL